MFKSIFNADNWFFRPFGWLVDIVMLSVLWALPSLLLLPFGAAVTALYDAAVHGMRWKEPGPCARFLRTLRDNLLTGGAAGLIALAAGYGLSRLHGLVYALADTGDRTWGMLYISFWVVLVVVNGFLAWWFPLLSRFQFKLGGLLSTGLRLAMGHLPTTLVLGLLTTVSLTLVTIIWPALFVPCLWALAASLPLERVFRPYMEAQRPREEDAEPPEA